MRQTTGERHGTPRPVPGTAPPAADTFAQRIIPPPKPGDGVDGLRMIERYLAEHETYRRRCLNLIASENQPSPTVARLQANPLSHRYGDYSGRDLSARKYTGNRYIVPVERLVTDLVKLLFGAKFVDLRPLSGHVAGAAVLMALCRPGDTVLELSSAAGGHRLAEKLCATSLAQLNVVSLPFDVQRMNVDVDRSRSVIRQLKPRVVILGASSFLFPHPVAALRDILDTVPDSYLVYDASHVLGLIAGNRFQQPLQEGAHVVVTSTHKTFAGPQGGMILTDDEELDGRIGTSVYPGLVTNHHLHRIPALGAACLEWRRYGAEHASAVIDNAQVCARELDALGLDLPGVGVGFTESHTVLVAVGRVGPMRKMAGLLEMAGILTGVSVLPDYWGRDGLRLGLQEVTRRGLGASGAGQIARLVADVLLERRPLDVCRGEASELAEQLDQCRFALEA